MQQQRAATPVEISQHFPPLQRAALVRAASRRDMAAIDAITDELAGLGLVRPRDVLAVPSASQQAAMAAGLRGL